MESRLYTECLLYLDDKYNTRTCRRTKVGHIYMRLKIITQSKIKRTFSQTIPKFPTARYQARQRCYKNKYDQKDFNIQDEGDITN